jgi:hypothetical protein
MNKYLLSGVLSTALLLAGCGGGSGGSGTGTTATPTPSPTATPSTGTSPTPTPSPSPSPTPNPALPDGTIPQTPTITSVTPSNGPIGTVITIRGTGFLPNVGVWTYPYLPASLTPGYANITVNFGAESLVSANYVDGNTITAVVPPLISYDNTSHARLSVIQYYVDYKGNQQALVLPYSAPTQYFNYTGSLH